VISYLYAFKIFNFQTLALDATVVIAITFLGSTIAGTIMPWRTKDVFEGSPIAKFNVPTWLGWVALVAYGLFTLYLIKTSFTYAWTVLTGIGALGADGATWFVVVLLAVLTLVNAGILLWILYYVF
jgi:hypothetical protein